jgi:1,4-alpha-glucan branching enzyme
MTAAALGACSSGKQKGGEKGGPEFVEGGVIFHFYDSDAKKVHVVGDFNNWNRLADPLVDRNGDGHWTLFYTLSPGNYQYKFVVNGAEWIPDPRNPESTPDGFDSVNSLLRIPAR